MQVNQALKEAKEKVVGLKQTLRAIQQDKISRIFIACDIEDHMVRKINEQSQPKGIPVIQTNLNQRELGRLCQIEVGASVVAIIK